MLGRFGEVFVTDWGTAINLKKDSSPIMEIAAAGERRIVIENTQHFRAGESIVITNDEEIFERNEIGAIQGNELLLRKKLSREYRPAPTLRVSKAFNMAGTPCYMAPEMAGHHLYRIGRCSDIYVLGGILFDMVTGRPPHTGSTVTHCLKNALDNDLIVPDGKEDDALLKIALKAMQSEPKNRYASVEEMQEAVRQYSRHAESISLTERSHELLLQAKATGDYETYSRAMFGFRDAIELWPENTTAKNGLLAARLEYAETAYGKGDFDLVVQTVDRSVTAENELYEKAQKAKQKRIERESRIKRLQQVIAAVVLFAVVGLSGLVLITLNEQRKAVAAAEAEKAAKVIAETKRKEAEDAKLVAQQAKDEEAAQKMIAIQKQKDAEEAERKADEQRLIAVQKQKEAEDERKKAEEARDKEVAATKAAVAARKETELKTIEIQLDEYQSSTALTSSQLQSLDIEAARENLARLKSASEGFLGSLKPAFDTWGWQRINMLSNADLPQFNVEGRTLASASSQNVMAIANEAGKIKVYSFTGSALTPTREYTEEGANKFGLAISPDGKQLAYAYTAGDSSGIKIWNLESGEPTKIASAGKRAFDKIAFSNDGKHWWVVSVQGYGFGMLTKTWPMLKAHPLEWNKFAAMHL